MNALEKIAEELNERMNKLSLDELCELDRMVTTYAVCMADAGVHYKQIQKQLIEKIKNYLTLHGV
jgi:hypothetical protein